MNIQTVGLWALSLANATALAILVIRATVAQARVRRSESDRRLNVALGSRVSSLSCRSLAEDGMLSQDKIGIFRAHSVIVFVRPRSVASFRLTELWLRLCGQVPPEVAWTWVVVGDPLETIRWVTEFEIRRYAVHCRRRRPVRRWSAPVPIAIYVDHRGRVAQAGAVSDELTLAHFIAGCPNQKLRDWFSAASTARKSGAGARTILG